MKTLLLANQPTKTTRLLLFQATLTLLGHEVIVPSFSSTSWIAVSQEAGSIIRSERPDIVHIFNVPDVIYRKIPAMKGRYFDRLIYDYRSPWGVEMQMLTWLPGRIFGEHYEKILARAADLITTVNSPLGTKVRLYIRDKEVPVQVIPNYPSKTFIEVESGPTSGAVLFVGRISSQEGVGNLVRLARSMPDQEFWVVGGGPLSSWYFMRKPKNIRLMGWQPHAEVARLIKRAKVCIVPRLENVLTPYSTDKSIWKLNEYLNLGKQVVASGITLEEERKNLRVTTGGHLEEELRAEIGKAALPLESGDYRFWEGNREAIKDVYEQASR